MDEKAKIMDEITYYLGDKICVNINAQNIIFINISVLNFKH